MVRTGSEWSGLGPLQPAGEPRVVRCRTSTWSGNGLQVAYEITSYFSNIKRLPFDLVTYGSF